MLLEGTAGNDQLVGAYGVYDNDSLLGLAGNDTLLGNEGDDTLSGGEGDDWLDGGADFPAFMFGDFTTYDSFIGWDGNDSLLGGVGNDTLLGGSDNDYLAGEDGNDSLLGGSGNDTLLGGNGDDVLRGGGNSPDADVNWYGSDVLFGGAGGDSLYGGAGNDWLNGEEGNDTLYGGEGNDTYAFFGLFGKDFIGADENPNSHDVVVFEELNHEVIIVSLYGDNLLLSFGAGNSVTIENWNLGGGDALNQFRFTDGNWALDNYLNWAVPADDYANSIDGASIEAAIVSGTTYTARIDYAKDQDYFRFVAPTSGMYSFRSVTAGIDYIDMLGTLYNADGTLLASDDDSGGNLQFSMSYDLTAGNTYYIEVEAYSSGNTGYYDLLVTESTEASEGNATLTGTFGDDWLVGGSGNDWIDGGDGNDDLSGEAGNDTLLGGNGDDEIYDNKGNDDIWGGAGSDTFNAGLGQDWLYGEEGDDWLYGGDGNDNLDGGDGNDDLDGGAGEDMLLGGAGNDWFNGAAGNDSLYGGVGNDKLWGGEGNDFFIFAGAFGLDTIHSDEVNPNSADMVWFDGIFHTQVVAGRSGNDLTLFYGEGNGVYIERWFEGGIHQLNTFEFSDGRYRLDDSLNWAEFADDHANSIDGASVEAAVVPGSTNTAHIDYAGDQDYFRFVAPTSGMYNIRSTTADGNDLDMLGYLYNADGSLLASDDDSGGGLQFSIYCDLVAGNTYYIGVKEFSFSSTGSYGLLVAESTEGNDTLIGTDGDDALFGGDGSEELYGGAGADTLFGGAGNDFFDAGTGDDYLFGEEGNDELNGGDGNEEILGGAGEDTLWGGAGNDSLHGGDGNDNLWGGAGNDNYWFGGIFGAAFGLDTIHSDEVNPNAADTVGFDGISHTQVAAGRSGNDLTLFYGEGKGVYLERWFEGGAHQLNTFVFSDGRYRLDDSLNWAEFADDHANSIDGASVEAAIVPGTTCKAHIDYAGDQDYFRFVAPTSGMYNIRSTTADGDAIDMQGYLYNADGSLLDFDGGGGLQFSIYCDLVAGNTYYIGAEAYFMSRTGSYGVFVVEAPEGNIALTGDSGDDWLIGGYGNDWIDGGYGNDVLDGGGGNDCLVGGRGADTLFGGEGDDILIAGEFTQGSIDSLWNSVPGYSNL